MRKWNNLYKINGRDVKYTYAGIDQYTVYRDGTVVGTCWSISDVAKMCEVDVETVNAEMWAQRWA